jgi:hypothetical protein
LESLKLFANTANFYLYCLYGYNIIDITKKVVGGFFNVSDATSFTQLVLLVLGAVIMVVRIQHSYINWKLDRQIKAENLKKLVNQNKEFNLNVEVAERLMKGAKEDKIKIKPNG